MGDRISISFKTRGEESVALFSFQAGIRLVETAEKYLKKLKSEFKKKVAMVHPLAYCHPNMVMMDFIHFLIKDMKREDVSLSFYLGISALDGDNTDNGHFIIDMTKMAKVYSKAVPGEMLKRQVVRKKIGDYEVKHIVDPWKEREKYGFLQPEHIRREMEEMERHQKAKPKK